MSLPFNSYDQMRYRGNEYVTDQVLNRTVYRLFQNDVYLDNRLEEHVADDSIHYIDGGDAVVDYLTSDKQVILPGFDNNNNVIGTWQSLIDKQPKNIGGNILVFRFQNTSSAEESNPTTIVPLTLEDTLEFSDFYGGTLIIESPEAKALTADNQRLMIQNNEKTAKSNAIISISNCHCKVLIRNNRFRIWGIGTNAIAVPDDTKTNDWDDKDTWGRTGNVYYNRPANESDDGQYEAKRYSLTHEKWYDLNMFGAIRINKSPDVEIKHCCIEY